jgi:hypothetical protein
LLGVFLCKEKFAKVEEKFAKVEEKFAKVEEKYFICKVK